MRSGSVGLGVVALLLQSAFLGGQPGNPHIVDTDPLPPAQQAKMMKLPPGFAIQLVAAEPKIKKPINIAFDAKGRLWVTGSEEYPFAAPPDRPGKDKLVILEDFAPDGQARKATVFADGLNIPIGVLPLPDCKSAIVFSIPNIYRLEDTDGDGKADKKDVLYSGYGYKDTHGMTGEFMWGFDGWIYCCHGYANASSVKGKDGGKVAMQSGNTYRIKPDGSKIEQFTWGQVNPFGLCFDELGNLYSADCHTRPIYQLIKGAYYPSFGKPHDGLGFAPEMVTHDHGSTGIAGIAYTNADHYPPEFRNNLFIGNVITNRINRDKIEWHGASPKGIEMPDFVTCDDRWFRPVDIKLGPDGALYVADFYNRIIGHYEVPLDHPLRDRERGRIWRIVYVGKDGKGKPHDYKPLPDRTLLEAISALGDPNLTVRTFAANELVRRGGVDVVDRVGEALAQGSPVQQAHALWVLERLGRLDAAQHRGALVSKDREPRVHALKILAERSSATKDERDSMHFAAQEADPFLRRAAAEALGSHRDANNLESLLQLLKKAGGGDPFLTHIVRLGLRQQMLDPRLMEASLASNAAPDACADIAVAIRTEKSAELLLNSGRLGGDSRLAAQQRVHHIARYGTDQTRVKLVETLTKKLDVNRPTTGVVVKAYVQATQERGGTLKGAEYIWTEDIMLFLLGETEPQPLQDGIELAGMLKLASAGSSLLAILKSPQRPEALRKSSVAALVAIEPRKHVAALAILLLDERQPIGLREQVASSLAAANQKEAYAALIAAFEKAPARLQTTIALGMAGSAQGGDQLLEAVAAGKASARLLQDKAIEVKLRQAKTPNVGERLAKLTRGLPPAEQKALELMNRYRDGFKAGGPDAAAGLKVFTKHCAACHQIKNQGSKIGPQLDGIGIRGLDRLLEDIFDPNRNVDQAFRATSLELENGQFVTGLFLREEGKVLVLADKEGKEVRVPGGQVVNRTVAQLSPMPANFAEQVPAKDFHDLMAYLLEQRVK